MRFARLLLLLGLAMQAIGTGTVAEETSAVEVRVLNEVLNPVSERLFGQFLERASFGEPGPEAALIPGTNRLQPAAVALMQEMRIPVIRFPGGLDVDYLDWRDMVDNVPDRAGAPFPMAPAAIPSLTASASKSISRSAIRSATRPSSS